MKKYVLTTVCVLALAALCQIPAFAQTYGQDPTWNIIERRIDERKTRERIRARQAKNKATKSKSAKAKSAKGKAVSSPAGRKASGTAVKRPIAAPKKVAASLPHLNIHIERDTFQDFHMQDGDGYVVTFSFAPKTANAKPLVRTYSYNYQKNNEVAAFKDLPPDTYTITAVAVYKGKKYPVHLGTTYGTPTDPTGGNFAPSVQLVVKAAKDFYGHMAVQGFPDTLYSRVIE